MTPTELLAPAKDLETGRDAVDCGADAVYIGAEDFSCRRTAHNPVADIRELAAYAHRWRVKVYAAVNTILSDEELPRAVDMLHRLWDAGVDAAIIADMGLLEADLPPIPLFASTQAHNADPEKVRFLEAVGFQRVMLARELPLAAVRRIRARSALELECFVHGSLGVAYSGRCYINQALYGTGVNRCGSVKPCRAGFTLTDEAGKVLAEDEPVLSLKDLNLSGRLRELLDAGVTGFKIEGRQKGRDYVRNVTAAYRRALDAALAGSGGTRTSVGESRPGFEPDLSKAPSRGYTEFFLDGRAPGMGAATGEARVPDEAFRREVLAARPERTGALEAPGPLRAERRVEPNEAPYPEKELDFAANVRNSLAERFYRRHGVARMEPPADRLPDLERRALMELKHCVRAERGLCPYPQGPASGEPDAAPLFLEDGQGARFRLDFDCRVCEMRLFKA